MISTTYGLFFSAVKKKKKKASKSKQNSCLAFCGNGTRNREELTVPVLFYQ